MRLGAEGSDCDSDACLSAVGLEAIEDAKRAARNEERGAKWYVISGCRFELSLLSWGEGGESAR